MARPRFQHFIRFAFVSILIFTSLVCVGCSEKARHAAGWKKTIFYPDGQDVVVLWRAQITERDILNYQEYQPLEDGVAAVDDGFVYVGGRSKKLMKFDRFTGKLIKSFKVGEEIFSQPVIDGQTLYLGTSTGKFLALNKNTFEELWSYPLKSEVVAAPVVQDGIVYFVTQTDLLTALDASSGKFKWEHREDYHGTLSIRRHAKPVVWKDTIIQGFTQGTLCAFNRKTGELLWRRNLGKGARFDDVNATPLVRDGFIYTASFDNGVYCLNAESGIVLWQAEIKSASSLVFLDGLLYLTASEDSFYALDLETGKTEWFMEFQELYKGETEGALSKPVPYKNRYVVFSTSGSGVYFMNYREKRLVQRFTPGLGISAPPTVFKQTVYVLSNGGYLYAFALGPKGSPFAPYRKGR